MYTTVAEFFAQQGYEWNFKDGRRIPTEEEIDQTIGLAIDKLSEEPDLAQLEVGRLIVQRHGQFYDIYVHIAEAPFGA